MRKKNNFAKKDERQYFMNITDVDELNFCKQIFDNCVNDFCFEDKEEEKKE